MKIVFIGCVKFSQAALEKLLELPGAEVVGVVTRRESPMNSDFASLEPTARARGIPCLIAHKNEQGVVAEFIRQRAPDVTYCFGWSFLLGADVLAASRLGVVGYHPARLPSNRGRHPLIWALALGLTETASTFFFMDQGADSGHILSQAPVSISDEDDASTLYSKITSVALEQIPVFTAALADGTCSPISQDEHQASYWRKRGLADGRIDWRMPANGIRNLVRALTRPYVGASFVHGGVDVKVWKVERTDLVCPNAEPGKVIKAHADGIWVKCGDGVVCLIEHELDSLPIEGTYL